jgi:hypothetical protein
MKRFTVDLDFKTWVAAHNKACLLNKSLAEIVRTLLTEWVKK